MSNATWRKCPVCNDVMFATDSENALCERIAELEALAEAREDANEELGGEILDLRERIAELEARLDAVKAVGFKHGRDDWSDGWDDAIKTVRAILEQTDE